MSVDCGDGSAPAQSGDVLSLFSLLSGPKDNLSPENRPECIAKTNAAALKQLSPKQLVDKFACFSAQLVTLVLTLPSSQVPTKVRSGRASKRHGGRLG